MPARRGGGYRPLGNTGIEISQLGFGCAAAWAKSVMGKPMISDDEAQKLLETAYELGIRYFDTGFNYGFAEERLGRILEKSKVVRRDQVVISTKFGERVENGKWIPDFSPEWMNKSLRISLKRMRIDSVDMLMCHGGEINDMTPDLLFEMQKLKEKGIIKAVGINTFDTDVIEWVAKTKSFDFVMLDYNILRQDREVLIKKLYDNGIGVIAGAPLAESLYSNRIFKIKSMKDLWYLARAVVRFRGQLIKGLKFRFINDVDGISGTQVALKYVLDNQYISSAVFGTTTIVHLEDNVKAQEIEIPDMVYQKIRQT